MLQVTHCSYGSSGGLSLLQKYHSFPSEYMGTLARDNLKILQQLRGSISEESGVMRSH